MGGKGRRERRDEQAGLNSGVVLNRFSREPTVIAALFPLTVIKGQNITLTGAPLFKLALVVATVDWMTCILKIAAALINPSFPLQQQTGTFN